MDMSGACGGGGDGGGKKKGGDKKNDKHKVPTLENAICKFLIYLEQEMPKLEGRKMTSSDVIIMYPILFDEFVRREIGGKVAEQVLQEFDEMGIQDEFEKDVLNLFEDLIDDEIAIDVSGLKIAEE